MPVVENSQQNKSQRTRRIWDMRILLGVALVAIVTIVMVNSQSQQKTAAPTPPPPPVPPAEVDRKLLYTFNSPGIIDEVAPMNATRSPYWWLNSGGKIIIEDGVGKSIQGDLPKDDEWYQSYLHDNPDDTDGGLHPQNLLRLVSRSTWDDVRVEASYFIVKDNLSSSANRNESNGLLLMSRYSDDGQTLYYAGIRVDGTAVIKKKYKGTYYTMDQKEIFPGIYNHETTPNLLPHNAWIRLRSDTTTDSAGTVTVKLSMLDEDTKTWKLLLSAKDSGQYEKTAPITHAHPIGLRTDFMDVKLDDILMQKL